MWEVTLLKKYYVCFEMYILFVDHFVNLCDDLVLSQFPS